MGREGSAGMAVVCLLSRVSRSLQRILARARLLLLLRISEGLMAIRCAQVNSLSWHWSGVK